MSSRIYSYLRWANAILILCTFLAYLSPYIHPATFWLLSFFGLIFPWLLLFNFLFLLFWLFLREKYFLLSLGCILMGWGNMKTIIGINGREAASESTLHVMTINTHSLRDKENKNKKLGIDDMKQFTRFEQVDILCLLEFPSGGGNEKYVPAIMEQSGLKYHHKDQGRGLLIFSAYPILNKGSKYFDNRVNGYQFIEIEKEGKKIRIYNLHLQSNMVSGTADKVAEHGNLQDKETWLDIKGMMGKYRYFTKKRANQAGEITTHIAKSPYPVIVCGDFNDVPQSHAYHLLTSRLNDGFKKKGNGLGFTFSGSVPGLRIDYVLASSDFKLLSYQKKNIPFSDHKAIISAVELRN